MAIAWLKEIFERSIEPFQYIKT